MTNRLPYILFTLQSIILVLACAALVWSWFDRLSERQAEQATQITQMKTQIAEQRQQITAMAASLTQQLDEVENTLNRQIQSAVRTDASARANRQKLEQSLTALQRDVTTLQQERKSEPEHIVARSITILDNQRRAALRMGTNDTRSFLQINAGENRSNTVMLNVFNDGRKALLFRNEAGRNRVGIITTADGQPSINLMDSGEIVLTTSKGFKVARLFEAKGDVGLIFSSAECKRKELWSIIRSYLGSPKNISAQAPQGSD